MQGKEKRSILKYSAMWIFWWDYLYLKDAIIFLKHNFYDTPQQKEKLKSYNVKIIMIIAINTRIPKVDIEYPKLPYCYIILFYLGHVYGVSQPYNHIRLSLPVSCKLHENLKSNT